MNVHFHLKALFLSHTLRKMEVYVPKFQMEQRYGMHELLPHLGISSVFLDSANLTGLSKDVGVKVSQVTARTHTHTHTLV